MKKSSPTLSWILLLAVAMFASIACQRPQNRTLQSQRFSWIPSPEPQQTNFLGPRSIRAKGEQHVLIVAVRFPDSQPRFSLRQIRKRVTADLNAYVKDQSYGKTWIKPYFLGWISLPDRLARYRISPNNFKVDRLKVRKLIEDTMTAVEKTVEFEDFDHLLIIPGVVTLPGKGYGMMCYCANPGMLTGVRGNPRFVTLRSRNGAEFSGGVFVGTENAQMGMFAHDFFHALGGVHERKRLVP